MAIDRYEWLGRLAQRVPPEALVMATYIAQQFRTVLNYPAGGTAAALLLVFAAVLTLLALQVRTREGGAA